MFLRISILLIYGMFGIALPSIVFYFTALFRLLFYHICRGHNIETNSATKSALFNSPHQHLPYPASNFLFYVRDHVHTYTYILIYACRFKTVHAYINITSKIKNGAYSKIFAVGILASSLLYILLDLKGQF